MAFVFYDAETTGIHTSFDQILQFGAIYTDPDLNELERLDIRCRLQPHVVPSPGAMRVTRLPCAKLHDPSLPTHYSMMRAIRAKFQEWSPAIFIGYSSLRFDEHLFRQALYKTLHPPYLTNTNGNSRSDALRMAQAASILAPNALACPCGDDGKPIFKLDRLAPANGFDHAKAHDALGDVEATMHLCRLLMEKAPDVWSMFMQFSTKAAVIDYVSSERVFSLSDFYFGRPYSWLVTSLGTSPKNASEFYVYNLGVPPESLMDLPPEELTARLEQMPKPMRRLRSNACPILMSAEDAPSVASALAVGMDELNRRAEFIHADDAFRQRLLAAFHATLKVFEPSPHVEMQIYDGFFSYDDEQLMNEFHDVPWEDRREIVDKFADARLKQLGRRLIYLERPDLFQESDCRALDRARARRVLGADGDVPWLTLARAIQQLDDMLPDCAPEELQFLNEHRQYLAKCLGEASALLN